MDNYKGSGDVVTVAAPEDASSGEFLIKGGIHGVAGIAVSSGADVPLHRKGVFTLPKETGTAWSQGDRLFWNASTKVFSKDRTDRPVDAVAAAAAGSDDATAQVLLGAEGGLRTVGGQHTTVDADDTVVTGLALVVAAVASLDSDPVIGATDVVATIGDQAGAPAAGSIQIKSFKPTAVDNATPTAATTFSKKVNWIAVGI
jgi:predicted RecA/RadA family phage recombinase